MQSAQRTLVQQMEFINVAAHELRTPIMPILINAELLQNDSADKSPEIEAIIHVEDRVVMQHYLMGWLMAVAISSR